MKLTVFLFTALLFSCSSPKQNMVYGKIKGNGKIVTKDIKVSDYESVAMGGGISCEGSSSKKSMPAFHYSQARGKATLKVSTDENLFQYLDIRTSNGRLIVSTTNAGKDKIAPTRFNIQARSSELTDLTVSGCMDFYLETALSVNELKIKSSGSTDVYLNNPVRVNDLNISVSGSGDIYSDNLYATHMRCNVSGSGDISLAGKAEQGEFRVSGSGDIKAYDFDVRDLECDVSGSGDARVYASGNLKAKASGSGDLHYKGDASVTSSKSGSGTIRNAN